MDKMFSCNSSQIGCCEDCFYEFCSNVLRFLFFFLGEEGAGSLVSDSQELSQFNSWNHPGECCKPKFKVIVYNFPSKV